MCFWFNYLSRLGDGYRIFSIIILCYMWDRRIILSLKLIRCYKSPKHHIKKTICLGQKLFTINI
jgi:hypothetical protein